MSDKNFRKITFTASEEIDKRTLVLLLVFDFATSNVHPPPSRQEQHPVVWKILKFQKTSEPGTLVKDVTYTDRLAFTKAKKMPPLTKDEERWILTDSKSLDPKVIREVNASQETMLVQNPNDPKEFYFADPIKLTYPSSVAMNGVQDPNDGLHKSQVDIAFGFYETIEGSNPSQILCFHEIPQYMPVSLQFVPFLQAYFVPEGFYREREVLTMPIPTPVALVVDIRSLSKDQKYSISIDDTNRAQIDEVTN